MKFKKASLSNGLNIIFIDNNIDSLSSTILVLVKAGSKYENSKNNGVSHFLEHMCFKGTEKYPSPLLLSSAFDDIGAEINAFTSQEYTGYYAKVLNNKLKEVIPIISDLYINPKIDNIELEKEKGVILEEINMYEDLPMKKVEELWTKLLYEKEPAGFPIAGTKDTVSNLKVEDLLNYRKDHYISNKTTFIISGNFNEEEIISILNSTTSNIKKGSYIQKEKVKDHQDKVGLLLENKNSDQTHIIIGFRSINEKDHRRFALEVFSNILAGNMSSRLFQKIREELGAAYYVRSDVDLYEDHGYFSIACGIDYKNIEKVTKAIIEEFIKIKEKGITEEELKRAKDNLSSRLLLNLESSDTKAFFIGQQALIDEDIFTPEEVYEKIQDLDLKDIEEIINITLKKELLNMVGIGPFKKEDHQKILSILNSF